MESARDRLIRLLGHVLDSVRNGVRPQDAHLEELVDALIEAARAPESAHTRTVADAQTRKP